MDIKKIEDIRNNNKKIKFELEVEHLKSKLGEDYSNKEDIIDRINKLNKIVENMNQEKPTIKLTNQKELYVMMDKYLYQKPWNKLNPIQKMIKIKEYLELEIKIKDKKQYNELIKTFEEYINNKKINQKHVIYNQTEGVIDNILILKLENNEYKINV